MWQQTTLLNNVHTTYFFKAVNCCHTRAYLLPLDEKKHHRALRVTFFQEISTRKNSSVWAGFFRRIVLRYIFIFELFLDSADGQKNLSKPVSEHCSKFRRVRPTRRGNHRRAAATTSTRRGNRVDAPRPPSPAIR